MDHFLDTAIYGPGGIQHLRVSINGSGGFSLKIYQRTPALPSLFALSRQSLREVDRDSLQSLNASWRKRDRSVVENQRQPNCDGFVNLALRM